ncbi:MAG: hypothetical protein EXR58_02685 [Chloroflexi bacterium]|nr:hypothetical protein [Chloroflexota bacterium]
MTSLLRSFDVSRGVVALAIAVLLFVYVHSEANPAEIATFEMPIDIVDVPPGLLVPPSQAAPTVRVRISAPRDTLAGIRSTSFRALVDLRKATSGANEYLVAVELPDPRIRLIEVVPSEIPIRLEELLSRRIPVRVNRLGSVPFGYEAGSPEANPAEVEVIGPSSVVQRVAGAGVDLRLDGATANLDAAHGTTLFDIQGQTVSTEGRGVRTVPESIRVKVSITQQITYKSVPVRPTLVGNVDPGFTVDGLTVEPSTVTVVGAPEALRQVDVIDTQTVDVADAAATLSRLVTLRIPANTSVPSPEAVRVGIRLSPLVVLQPFNIPISFVNLSSGLQVAGSLSIEQITVRGASTAIRSADPAQIRATVDLSGLTAGTYDRTVTVSLPGELSLQSSTPSSISVQIAAQESAPPPP